MSFYQQIAKKYSENTENAETLATKFLGVTQDDLVLNGNCNEQKSNNDTIKPLEMR